jgi:hypothetical protein
MFRLRTGHCASLMSKLETLTSLPLDLSLTHCSYPIQCLRHSMLLSCRSSTTSSHQLHSRMLLIGTPVSPPEPNAQ